MLIKPNPVRGESWPGYLLRLAELNHLRGIPPIAKALGLSVQNLIITSPSQILPILGIGLPTDIIPAPLTPPRGRSLLGYHGRSNRTRICPLCIGEMPILHIPSAWDKALTWHCQKHNLLLLDTCHECHSAITYERIKISSCPCGAKFHAAPRVRLKDSVLRDICETLTFSTESADSGITFQASSSYEFSCAQLIRRMLLLSTRTLIQDRRTRNVAECFVSSHDALAVAHWFSNWPVNFVRELHLAKELYRMSPTQLLLPKGKNLVPIPVVIAAIRLLTTVSSTAKLAGTKMVLAPVPPSTLQHVGLTYVLRRSGTTYDVVRFWIDNGNLGEVEGKKLPNGQWKFKIDRAQADKAILIARSTATLKNLASEIGIDIHALRALANAGVLHIVPFGRAKYNFRLLASQAYELTASFLKVAKNGKRSSLENVLVEKVLLYLHLRHRYLVADFVHAILDGTVTIRKFTEPAIRFDDLVVRRVDYLNWVTKARQQ